MNKFEETLKLLFKPGTKVGMVSFGAAFFLLGLLFSVYGFWKTLLILFLTALGVFIGSEETIGKATAKLLDTIYPPKNKKVVYTQADLEKVRKAAEMKKTAQKEAVEPKDSGEPKEAKD